MHDIEDRKDEIETLYHGALQWLSDIDTHIHQQEDAAEQAKNTATAAQQRYDDLRQRMRHVIASVESR